jgi:hypothetical protein
VGVSALWTVLVPTIGQRRDYLCQMLDGLLPQVDAQGGKVNVLCYWDNGEVSIAAKKQALLEAADGEYISYVDDDDTVSKDYVAAIVAALASRPDYVGLKLQVYEDGRPFALSHHSLRHGGWIDTAADTPKLRRELRAHPELAGVLRRDITCANPMRADIARTAKFTGARGDPEDRMWASQLRDGGLLRTEVFVDRVLYHYWWAPSQSVWIQPTQTISTTDQAGRPWRPLQVASPHFAWHPASPLPQGDDTHGGDAGGDAHHRAGAHPDVEHQPADRRVRRHARRGRR